MSESTRRNGGRSLTYAEPIKNKWSTSQRDISVRVVREATLSEDLTTVDDRRLRAIRIGINTDTRYADHNEPVDLSREDAVFLHQALGEALTATEKDETL